MSRKKTRLYLPRSTIDMAAIITIEQVSKERGISFGRAVELMLLESAIFNEKMKSLKKDAPWLDE